MKLPLFLLGCILGSFLVPFLLERLVLMRNPVRVRCDGGGKA